MIEYIILVVLFIIALIFNIYAQYKVKSNYNKFRDVNINSNLTGAEVAKMILEAGGLNTVAVTQIEGELTDNYNNKKKLVSLSSEVYSTASVASAGIAAHEVGHALQYKDGYAPIKIRNFLVPVANFISNICWPIIIIGFIFDLAFASGIIGDVFLWIAIVFFALPVIIHAVTLPVEFDASNRAKAILERSGICSAEEMQGVCKVLNSAALTYVAALLTYIVQLLRILAIFASRRRD